jgi:hypothetical protein
MDDSIALNFTPRRQTTSLNDIDSQTGGPNEQASGDVPMIHFSDKCDTGKGKLEEKVDWIEVIDL